MNEPEKLIPLHGGYRKLKSFQVAQLAYDVTVRFCDRYIEKRSRTHDQMVQAARSGVQNIADGSQASGTSKKAELTLPNVVRAWVEAERSGQTRTDTDRQGRGKAGKLSVPASVQVRARPCVPGSAELVANAALSLLNLACYLLDKQLAAQEKAFVEEGGFTERLYRVRSARRK